MVCGTEDAVSTESGSYLGLEFWVDGKTDSEAVALIAQSMESAGGLIGPTATVLDATPEAPYRSITEHTRRVVPVSSVDDLGQWVGTNQLVGVEVSGVLTFSAHPVRVGVSRTRTASTEHPVAALLPDLIDWDRGASRPDPTGREARNLFIQICRSAAPGYGGLFVEFTMPDPSSVKGNGSFFRDVYFRRSFVGDSGFSELAAAAGVGPEKENDDELFVFTTPELGPVSSESSDGFGSVVERVLTRVAWSGA